ncbi:S41 family peptidase [Gillisia sp. Q332]|uniref:S41 family peptidase n=1 Tax=Gillisia xinjiangensis TaxID=3384765 RepID=UPI00391CE10B
MKNSLKIHKLVLFAFLFIGITSSCSNDADDIGPTPPVPGEERNLVVENFIYRGMNEIYLYKADVPVLADNYFSSQTERNDFLDNYSSPEDLFDNGVTASQDRFSFLVDDYVELENLFSGISKTSGLSYGLVRYCSSCSEIFGYVRLVLPNTSADEEGVERGMIFNRVDGQQLTDANYQTLLAPDTFTIGLAKIEDSSISNLDETFTLTKREYVKNPVFVSKVIETEGKKVGYIYYDSFTGDFDKELNDAFGEFKNASVTDLVLDLRYNGGGSVRTATDLASMITGQFAGDIFMKEVWNAKYQAYFESTPALQERLLNKFNTTLKTGELINSLNLGTVYVLTTNRSASASELVINGLTPYIDVVQIGETTTGKFQASVTLYDSQNFGRENANTTHTYAIQPLVLKSVNSAGVSDYINGLDPDYAISEDYQNLGQLGDPNEPFLKLALDVILGNRVSIPESIEKFKPVGESGMDQLDYQKMYIDKIPELIN